eukprot:CAMPEP_0197025568 /NCGR_PEP_ID=MMETSP1384-20130603/5851_1 /TAXON_ID=29189 /ORGANISM="Ammonia sp." /LENGTH=336 /DNA_ID=CAMNT_0042454107 /DNA_START=455 /DNA_END=1462 /DNA_ORIENTATION=+
MWKWHSKEMEQAVLQYCRTLWNAHDDTFWGYISNMGSSEGNLVALWNAREYLTRAHNGNSSGTQLLQPAVLFSEKAHGSVSKYCKLLRLEAVHSIQTDQHGQMDIDVLCDLVEQCAKESRPIIIVYTMGTTVDGAYDDCATAIHRVSEIIDRYQMHGKYWNHLDGALGGFVIPYLRKAKAFDMEHDGRTPPDFGFHLDIQSCTASFHKWFGAPYPMGVFMTKREYLLEDAFEIAPYIGVPDNTLATSRNAISACYMWYRLALVELESEVESIRQCMRHAQYLAHELNAMPWRELNAHRSPFSLATTFNSELLSAGIREKHSIPQQEENGVLRSRIW